MTKLYLVRHAWPEVRPGVPPDQWPLAVQGQAAATGLGRSVRGDGIVAVRSSEEIKAAETAELIADALDAACGTDPDLGEVRQRAWVEDGYEATVERFFSQPDRSPDGWERAADAQARFAGAVGRFAETLGGGHGLVVAHGLVLALYLARFRGQAVVDLDDWRAVRLPDLAVVDLGIGRILRPFGAPTPYRP